MERLKFKHLNGVFGMILFFRILKIQFRLCNNQFYFCRCNHGGVGQRNLLITNNHFENQLHR